MTETRACQNCKKDFVIEPADFDFYKKIDVPPPTFCPLCRLQRRLAYRNERFMFKKKCASSGREIFSLYPGEAPVVIYENVIWHGDSWDALSYGVDVDFSRPFLDQVFELYNKAPLYALSTVRGVNSEFSGNFDGFKNCYLCFNGNDCEDCMYSVTLDYLKNCVDVTAATRSENCYGSFWLNGCTNVRYSRQCADSFNLLFCKSCFGCNDCFGSVNLRNKKYYIFNQPYSKEEYEAKMKEFNLGSHQSVMALRKQVEEFWLQHPVKYIEGLKNTNVSGEYIFNSKNTKDSWTVWDAENSRFLHYMERGPIKDSYDYTVWGSGADSLYECLNVGLGAYNIKFSDECWQDVRNIEYSFYCLSSSGLFGCVSLKKKQYCILNKQYTKEEYELLVPKIKKHMDEMPYVDKNGCVYSYGEFFPAERSAIPYNNTPAQEHFPLTKKAAAAKGYFWRDGEERKYVPSKQSQELPDLIGDVQDGILKEVILCEDWASDPEKAEQGSCTKAFRITPQELSFYRRFNIPLPRKCPNSRHLERINQRNGIALYERKCGCLGTSRGEYKNMNSHLHGTTACENTFQTAYGPEQPQIVYCEQCYQQEVL